MPSASALAVLFAALVMPWLLGAAVLAAGPRSARPGGRARRLAYGFFLGYALLFGLLLLQDALWGGPSPLAGLALLAALALLALLAARRAGPVDRLPRAGAEGTPPHRVLFGLFLAFCIVHLVLGAVEVLHRPVFPWDGWLSWMYRARAWFHAGTLLPMDSPGAWGRGIMEHRFNVDGHHYPRFVPAVALWAALALGQWSETLVSLPYVLLAAALALAVYGEARALELPRWGAALCSYLLLSVPLLGTHLSLAGQADAWMAGYAGLGFAVLLRGLALRDRRSLLLGLALVAFSMCIKVEGRVWLLLALLLCATCLFPRLSLLGLGALVAAGVLAWFCKVSAVTLPVFGPVGIVDGRLQLPFLGSHALAPKNLSGTFLRQFAASGSWHLLWPGLGLACVAGLGAGRRRPALCALVFLLLLVAVQGFIFMVSEQSRWAEDVTAINRLALHFLPALIIALVLLSMPLRASLSKLRPGLAALAAVPAAGVVVGWVLAGPGAPEGDDRSLPLSADELIMRAGQGYLADGARVVSGFDQGIAVASARRPVNAEQFALLRLDTRGDNRKQATFFWRRAASPEALHSLTLEGRGVRWRDLAREPAWTGTLAEVGVLFYDDGGRAVRIDDLTLKRATPAHRFALVLGAWREHRGWSMQSVNFLTPGTAPLETAPPLQLLLGLLLALPLAAAACRRRGAPAGPTLLLLTLLAWLLLDARWLAERSWRAGDTLRQYPLVTARALAYGDDVLIRQLVERATAGGDSDRPLLLASLVPGEQRMELRRARYHALPRPAYVFDGDPAALPPALPGDLLLLRQRYGGPERAPAAAELAERLGAALGTPLTVGFATDAGVLLERRRPPGEVPE